MTRKQLARVVERWRALLMPEWRVKLMDEPPPGEDPEDEYFAISQVPNPQYQELLVYFPDHSLRRADTHSIEVTVVHELLHGLCRDVVRTQLDDLQRYVPPNVHDDAVERAVRAEEGLVDRLSRVLVVQAGAPRLRLRGTRQGSGDEFGG